MKFPTKNIHKVVPKGWGREVHIHNDADYCCKLLHLNQGVNVACIFTLKKRNILCSRGRG